MVPELASEVYKKLSPLERVAIRNQILLMEKGKFCFKEGDRYLLASSSDLTNSYGVLESRLVQSDIAPSDLFIAYAVAMLGATDYMSIMDYMNWMHKKWPEKIVPYNINIQTLKARLEKLARAGVVRCFSIVNGDTRRGVFYSISELGARAVRRRLDIEFLSYDTWPLVDCEHRVWRKLMAQKAGCSLLPLNPDSPVQFYSEIYDKNLGSKVPVYARQTIKYKDKENQDKEAFIIVEPVSYVSNKLLRSEEEVVEDIKKRMGSLFGRIDIALGKTGNENAKKFDKAFIIFIVDDLKGLQKTAGLIYETSATALEHCLFTTERIIKGNNGKLNRCFFSANVKDGRARATFDTNNSDIFGPDDFSVSGLKFEDIVTLGLASKADTENEEDIKKKFG